MVSGSRRRRGDSCRVLGLFREGRDDARYIYTLQQAIVERESSNVSLSQTCAEASHAGNLGRDVCSAEYLDEGCGIREFNARAGVSR